MRDHHVSPSSRLSMLLHTEFIMPYNVTESDFRFQENPNATIITEIYNAISSFHCRVIFGISAKNGLLFLYCNHSRLHLWGEWFSKQLFVYKMSSVRGMISWNAMEFMHIGCHLIILWHLLCFECASYWSNWSFTGFANINLLEL